MIIWIFGPSAVGKATLIRKIADGKFYKEGEEIELLGACGVTTDHVIIPVIIYNKKVRSEILHKVFQADSEHIAWIIHGQALDMETLPELCRLNLDVKQFCFYLYTTEEDYNHRTAQRKQGLSKKRAKKIPDLHQEAYKGIHEKVAALEEHIKETYILKY